VPLLGGRARPSVLNAADEKTAHGKYMGKYIGEHGKRLTRTTGTTDYDAAFQIASKWQTHAALCKSGVIDASLARFAEHNKRPPAGMKTNT
jgi:hypothetical protein